MWVVYYDGCRNQLISKFTVRILLITLAASNGKRKVTVWCLSVRPSVCLSVPSFSLTLE